MRRIIVVIAGCLLVLAGAGIALAQEYPVQTGPLSTSNNVVPPGGTLEISGNGFVPGTNVQLTIESTPVSLGSTNANGAGAINTTVTIPSSTTPGTHTVKATGAAPGGGTLVLSVSVSVTGGPVAPAADAVPTESIAFTGSNSVGFGALGAGLVFLGLLLVGISRRIGIRTV